MQDGSAGTLSKALAWFHGLEQTLRIQGLQCELQSCHPRGEQPLDGPGSRQATLHSLKSGCKVGSGVGGGMEQGCWGRLEADETPLDFGSDTCIHISLCISHAPIIFWHYIF